MNNSFDKIVDMTINGDFACIEDSDVFRQYFCKFILSCACSFPNVRGRDKSYFVEEYVIPQLVTQLLTKSFRGIHYNTINGYRDDENQNDENQDDENQDEKNQNDKNKYLPNNYVNYAFFTKQKSDEPVDEELRKRFIVDGPITVSRLEAYNQSRNYSISEIVDIVAGHFGKVECFNSMLSQIENNQYYRKFINEKQS